MHKRVVVVYVCIEMSNKYVLIMGFPTAHAV